MGQHQFRCLVCGSSELDDKGRKCGLCGKAVGLRSWACEVSKKTQQRLLDHSQKLLKLGVELRRRETLEFKEPEVEITEQIALEIDESMRPGTLIALVGLLRDLSVPEEEVLRLRLDEPERILKYYRTRTPNSQATRENVTPIRIQGPRFLDENASAARHRKRRVAVKAPEVGHATWRRYTDCRPSRRVRTSQESEKPSARKNWHEV